MPIEPDRTPQTTERERAAVDRALAGAAAAPRRSDLLPLLHALQDDLGWLPEGALRLLADRLRLPFPDVWGVATFYALFRLEAPRGAVVHVCDDVPCRLRGADALVRQLESRYGPPGRFAGEAHRPSPHRRRGADAGGPVDWETVPCLGRCDEAPAAVVAGRELPHATLEGIAAAASPGRADG